MQMFQSSSRSQGSLPSPSFWHLHTPKPEATGEKQNIQKDPEEGFLGKYPLIPIKVLHLF